MPNRSKSFAKYAFYFLLPMTAMQEPSNAMEWHDGMNPASLNGSFIDSCAECVVDEIGYMTCRCVNNAGRMSGQSAIGLGYCNRNGPDNRNGKLECRPIIRGSWAQSCQNGLIDEGNTLHAECKDTLGQFHYTAIILLKCPSMNLENINGQLRCKQ
jgi:CVNH domain